MADARTVSDTPEFHLVVKRANRRSPLAPYRFVITLTFALAVCGLPLWRAVESGHGLDDALLRVAGAALFAWFVLGRINRILSGASQPGPGAGSPPTTPTG